MLDWDIDLAKKGAQATVVDGKVEFPETYRKYTSVYGKQKQMLLSKGDIIFIQWNKADPRYFGAEDGDYYSFPFVKFQKNSNTNALSSDKNKTNSSLEKINFDKINAVSAPKNNDGRKDCFWCASPTKKQLLFSSVGNICTKCGR